MLHGAGSSQHGSHTALSVETGELAKGGVSSQFSPFAGSGRRRRAVGGAIVFPANATDMKAARVRLCPCATAVELFFRLLQRSRRPFAAPPFEQNLSLYRRHA